MKLNFYEIDYIKNNKHEVVLKIWLLLALKLLFKSNYYEYKRYIVFKFYSFAY
jgi:hypothetical protein